VKILFLLTFVPAAALAVTVGQLPPSAYADTEASTNVAFSVDGAWRRLKFRLALEMSPSNGVEVAVGTDADGDGRLSPDESAHVFGCDCGVWFSRDLAADDEFREAQPASGRCERTFTLRRRELDSSWNLLRVTRRGPDVGGELTKVVGELSTMVVAW